MYKFLLYLLRISCFWEDNRVWFMCLKIEGAFDPRIMIQWCFQLLTLLAIYFVFGKNRSGFIIPKEATPANNMAPATSNHHGWWQRKGIASIGGEKSPLQNTSLVHQMWTNTNIKGCLLNSSYFIIRLLHAIPVWMLHALIGENFPT